MSVISWVVFSPKDGVPILVLLSDTSLFIDLSLISCETQIFFSMKFHQFHADDNLFF